MSQLHCHCCSSHWEPFDTRLLNLLFYACSPYTLLGCARGKADFSWMQGFILKVTLLLVLLKCWYSGLVIQSPPYSYLYFSSSSLHWLTLSPFLSSSKTYCRIRNTFSSTTFCGHMFGYWIPIGLKRVLWDNNLELSQGDILIGLKQSRGQGLA